MQRVPRPASRRPKQVFFVRHCESQSNVLFDKGKKEQARALADPLLSHKGERQAAGIQYEPLLQELLEPPAKGLVKVLLAVSPLRRALQTVEGAFGGWLRERRKAGAAVRLEVRHELREFGSGDYDCDRPGPVAEVQEEFASQLPGLQIAEPPAEELRRQSKNSDNLAERLGRFTHWVQAQPEDFVVVVGHQNVFWNMLETDFHNGEVRLYSIDGSGAAAAQAAPPSALPLVPPWQPVWPPPALPRSALICMSPRCNFLVHSNPDMAGYCCVVCYEGGGHGPRCERKTPRPGSGCKKLNGRGEVTYTEEEQREALAGLRLLLRR